MNITIIGNNAFEGKISDGGRIKIRLFKRLLEREHHHVTIIELDNWKKRIFGIISSIKKAIRQKERIIIMAGPKGCRVVIPIVLMLNHKKRSKIVFCPLGIGTLDSLIRKLTPEDSQLFLSGGKSIKKNDNRMARMLSKCEYVVVQNDILKNRYISFYKLNNVVVLENFRDVVIKKKQYDNELKMKIIYLSRVKRNKGIFDLISVVNDINSSFGLDVNLDIYGEIQMNDQDSSAFKLLLNDFIHYCGVAEQNATIDLIKQYDVFCLPTKYYGEGTPGALIESMIAGTPALISSYSQSSAIIKNGIDGFIFTFNSVSSLKDKILYILENKSILAIIGENAQSTAKKYTYCFNRGFFLRYLAGDECV